MASRQLFSTATRCMRQMSTSASTNQLVKAPIQLYGVEGRYAHALYSAAVKSGALEVTESELLVIQQALKDDAALASYCKDPSIKKSDKKAALESTMAQMDMSAITGNFVSALAENSRLPRADGIIEAFNKIMSAHRGEVSCSITTAKPLDDSTQSALLASLQKFVGEDKTLIVSSATDASLLGGMVVNIDEYFIDMSIKTKIKKISQNLSYSA